MSYGTSVTLDVPFADAVGRVRAARKSRGSAYSPRSTSPPPCVPGSASRSSTTSSWAPAARRPPTGRWASTGASAAAALQCRRPRGRGRHRRGGVRPAGHGELDRAAGAEACGRRGRATARQRPCRPHLGTPADGGHAVDSTTSGAGSARRWAGWRPPPRISPCPDLAAVRDPQADASASTWASSGAGGGTCAGLTPRGRATARRGPCSCRRPALWHLPSWSLRHAAPSAKKRAKADRATAPAPLTLRALCARPRG